MMDVDASTRFDGSVAVTGAPVGRRPHRVRGPDGPEDAPVWTSELRLARLASAAAEAGAYFARTGVVVDVEEWLRKPSPLLGGRSPLSALQDRNMHARATMAALLGIGFDLEPDAFDAVVGLCAELGAGAWADGADGGASSVGVPAAAATCDGWRRA